MEISNMKNIVVLKNLPSNIVDEAIVILKSNKNAKRLEYADKNTKAEFAESVNTKDYMVKEAELIISNYISKIENNKKSKTPNVGIEKKYKKLKVYSIFASLILLLCIIKSIF